MDYYKKKEEINRCLKQYFPPELKVIVEGYYKEAIPWKEEIKNRDRPIYEYTSYENYYNKAELMWRRNETIFILSELDIPYDGERHITYVEISKGVRVYKAYDYDYFTKKWEWIDNTD